jgi:hypothetical protein
MQIWCHHRRSSTVRGELLESERHDRHAAVPTRPGIDPPALRERLGPGASIPLRAARFRSGTLLFIVATSFVPRNAVIEALVILTDFRARRNGRDTKDRVGA